MCFLGRYYLVDSGYAGEAGYLGPYRNSRYHLREFERRRAENWEEIYNFHHSSLRNVVERLFGVLKARWQMMQGVPRYPREKQSKIILACFGLHNYMEGLKPRTPGTPMNQWTHAWLAQNSTEDMGRVRDWIKYGVASLQLR